MTRRAGGADSRPAPMEQSDRQDSTTLHHGTTQHHTAQSLRAKETDTRPTERSTQHRTASAERPHTTAPHSAQHATRQTMKRDTHELYRTQAILLTRRAAHASNIARVARLIRAHATGARAVIRVEGGPRINVQFSSRGIAPTACSLHQLLDTPTASHSKRYSVLHEQPRHPYTEPLSGP